MSGGKPCGAKVHKGCADVSSASPAPIDVYSRNVSVTTGTLASTDFKKGEKGECLFSFLPHLAPMDSPYQDQLSCVWGSAKRLCLCSGQGIPCMAVLAFAGLYPVIGGLPHHVLDIIHSTMFTRWTAKYLPDLIYPIKLWIW